LTVRTSLAVIPILGLKSEHFGTDGELHAEDEVHSYARACIKFHRKPEAYTVFIAMSILLVVVACAPAHPSPYSPQLRVMAGHGGGRAGGGGGGGQADERVEGDPRGVQLPLGGGELLRPLP